MKKLFALLLILTLLCPAIPVVAESAINVTLDGKTVMFPDAKPFIVSGRVMVPVRFVSQALGAEVGWVQKENKVTIKKGGSEISLFIGDREVSVNGKMELIDAPPQIQQSRTFVPLRFVSQTLGSFVKWEDWSRTVVITSLSPYGKGEEIDVHKAGGGTESVIAYDMKMPFKEILGIEKVDNTYVNVIVSRPVMFTMYLSDMTEAGIVRINGSFVTPRGDQYLIQFNTTQYTNASIESFEKLGFRFTGEEQFYFRVDNPLKK